VNYKYIITSIFAILNISAYSQNTDSLIFSKEQGYYTKPFELKITNTSPDNTIYYTLDGSIPTKNCFIYKAPVKIDYRYNAPNVISNIPTTLNYEISLGFQWVQPKSHVFKATVIRAVSYKNQKPSSKVYTYTFFVDTAMYLRYNYPVISLVTNPDNFFDKDKGIYVPGKDYIKTQYGTKWSGNYLERGKQWERPVNIAFFEKNGDVAFSQNAGVRIHGHDSRRKTQKSLRLYARKEYGKKILNYKLFLQKNKNKFKRFILQASFRGNVGFNDLLIHDIARNLNIDAQDYRPVIIFINGEYWGIHTIKDRIDKYYLSSKYNVDKNKIDILENDGTEIEGSKKNYRTLILFIKNNDLTDTKNYEYIKTQIDIENYINYQITNIYFNVYDWVNNIKFWRAQTSNGKWRWILYDSNSGLKKDYTYNSLQQATVENKKTNTLLFRNLLKNKEFKNQFINTFALIINTDFSKDTVINKINQFENIYQLEIKEHIERWLNVNTDEFISTWHNNIDKLRGFAINRPFYMKKYLLEEFNLDPKYFDNN
jgi:hypothetical protein